MRLIRAVAVIPARYASSRFPGKVLAPIEGKPMIQWVWERVSLAAHVHDVVVATDDQRVFEASQSFGAHAMLTSPDHQSGTERCSEVAAKIVADIIINVQGDEPLINPRSVELVAGPLIDNENLGMSTLKYPISSFNDYHNPNIVKVVCDDQENAIYFSRAPIPFYRGQEQLLEKWEKKGKRPAKLEPAPMKHIGIYAYRADFLQAVARMPRSPLESAELLEQLRVLAWGFKIRVVTTPHDSVSVDVPEDMDRIHELIAQGEK